MFGKPKKKISLESAILAGEMKEVRRSLESGTDPNQPISDERGGYPLHFAVNSSIEIIQMLIEHGADVNVKDAKGRTPLHIVAASKPTIHGHIHGRESKKFINTRGVEEYQVNKYSS